MLDEENCNTSANRSLMDVLEERLTRRNMLRVGVGSAGAAVLGTLAACGGGDVAEATAGTPTASAADAASPLRLSFTAVPKNTEDRVTVPAGYTATVLYALGDPLDADTPAYRNDGSDTDFEHRAGDHHDGLEFFGLAADGSGPDRNGSTRGILAVNHEALTDQFLHPAGVSPLPRPKDEADKEMPAHGLSFVEVRRREDGFARLKISAYNRRVTPLTRIRIHGPVRGHDLVKTRYSPAGEACRGTINNCGTGKTPWGTFLTGEENWAGYFTRSATDDAARSANSVVSLNRYGRPQGSASRHGWETAGPSDRFGRWDISQVGSSTDGTDDYRNEMNTFGWIVEADPYDASQVLRKRTALGRFAHESAAFGIPVAGRPLAVYMGDDSRGEYVYKFVSAANWRRADARAANRITTGDKYLDDGKLYAAKFHADGSGEWIELSIDHPAIQAYATYNFASQADVLVNARLAADAVGATRMDRPEWCAVHPVTGEVYYTMTNNSNRKVEPASGSQQQVDPANPRSYLDAPTAASAPGNVNGHIVRLREDGGESRALGFTWDIYLFGAEAGADPALVNLSSLTADQDFSSPDGLWFSRKTGLCFIQTDDGAYTDTTNCMMLVGIPGEVGDGEAKVLRYTKGDGTRLNVRTRIGARPTEATLRRFLVGPVGSEITGIAETPDGKALFVNIQHPGENISREHVGDPSQYQSHWPGNAGYGRGGANARPRSATIVITRDDGGLIGADGTPALDDL